MMSVISFGQEITVQGLCTDRSGHPLGLVKISDQVKGELTFTNEKGYYQFKREIGDTLRLVYRVAEQNTEEQRIFIIKSKADSLLPGVKFDFQMVVGVDVQGTRIDPFELPVLPILDFQQLPFNLERSLVFTTAAVSNNELTSNYNVRGGSYDENLVYVNGFLINRPFLTRSGQQEGMSFVYSALVQSLSFSAGGFDATYGDKLSSVLDINYRTPDSLRGSFMASLLGVEAHVEDKVSARFNYLVGARYRSNGYLLNSLPTKGSYNPVFYDAQVVTNYAINEKLNWSLLGHFSSNEYRFNPQTSKTDFGTANEAYSFVIYFEGQERTKFQTLTGGTSLNWSPREETKLDFYATVFNSNEKEYFDILGQYYINELETDPSKEEFGDSIAVLGVGGFLNHARNKLNATIVNVYHNGSHELYNGIHKSDDLRRRKSEVKWGVNFQQDLFDDVLSEWKMVDSAGYSLPQSTNKEIVLFETIKGKASVQSQRYTGFILFNNSYTSSELKKYVHLTQKIKGKDKSKSVVDYYDTINVSIRKVNYSLGTRVGYTSINNEFFVTPRFTFSYLPRRYMVQQGKIVKRDVAYRFSTGLYYQPPFYRELRTYDGEVRPWVKSQKSVHFVAGWDYYFNMWDRESPFKLTTELYYKYLWDVNPFEVQNVRTRYLANNDAVAFAYGVDVNVHGQFVDGIESYFKLGLLRTKEDILTDAFTEYYNAAGERIIFGISEDQTVVDSAVIYPGYVPRPTDQWVNFGALIQDQMPGFESFSVQMGLQFGSPLPYGPPDFDRYKDTLRMKSYFRVDIGFSYDFLYKEQKKANFINRNFTDAILSFEVFNLLGVNNVLSKQWIQDVEGKYYSIPNYLTQRRFNLKLLLRF